MKIIGKLVGALIGFLLFRNVLGITFGLAIGHAWDQGLLQVFLPRKTHDGALVGPLFSLAGAVAKADGRISQAEVAATEKLVARMDLDPGKRSTAIEHFNRGKVPGFDALAAARELRAFCGYRGELKLMLLDVLLDVGLADGGRLSSEAERILKMVAHELDVAEHSVDWLLQRRNRGPRQGGGAGGGAAQPPPHDPYAVLGLSSTATESEIRRAYRKLMAQHHPDKLQSRGASAEMIGLAEERARELNAAYERIKSLRGMA